MKHSLYKAILKKRYDEDKIWEFEAISDGEAIEIVNNSALKEYGVYEKKLFKIGEEISPITN
jgi:hypothetical protein